MSKYVLTAILWCCTLISFSQDLLPVEYKGRTTFKRYAAFKDIFTIKNNGIVPIDEYIVNYVYISEDQVLDYDDVLLGTGSFSAIDAGEALDVEFTPYEIDKAPGVYNLIVSVDEGESILETDETNNVMVIPNITIENGDVDLKLLWTEPGSPLSVTQGSKLYVPFSVENAGSTTLSASFYTLFYLSTDQVIDESDFVAGGYSTSWFSGPHQDYLPMPNDPFSFGAVPLDIPIGDYYLIGKLDAGNDYVEVDEANNIGVMGSVTVTQGSFDLYVSYADGAHSSSTDVWFEMNNTGTPLAFELVKWSVYISTDQVPDPGDYKLPYYNSASSNELPASVKTSDYGGIPPGMYYAIIVLNDDNSIPESDYSNNIFIVDHTLIVTPPPVPKVSITNAAFSNTYTDTDLTFELNVDFVNSGDVANIDLHYDIMVINSANNVVFQDAEWITANFSGAESEQWALALDQVLSAGDYTLQITTSSEYSLTAEYNLPFTINRSLYSLIGGVVGEDGTTITKGKLFLYYKDDAGAVKFIDKKIFDAGNQYEYNLDADTYTLYYIPDPIAFPEFVPTIYGKTVTLKPTSFFTLSADAELNMEILKVQPLAVGPMSISGNVNTTSFAGRISAQRESAQGYPVILLNSSDIPVKVSTVDANGNYSFDQLPEGEYKIIIAFELDEPQMSEPVLVDVTVEGVVLDFDLSGESIASTMIHTQRIAFDPISEKTFGDAAFVPEVSISTGLPLTLTTSDENVAVIQEGKIVIVNAGTCSISATQTGTPDYAAASAEQQLVIKKAAQQIDFGEIGLVNMDQIGLQLVATSTSGLPVAFNLDNNDVAKIDANNYLTFVGPGIVHVSAAQKGNKNYLSAPMVTRTLVVDATLALENSLSSIKLYPNPFNDHLFLNTTENVLNVRLIDVLGHSRECVVVNNSLDIRDIASGIYFVKLTTTSRSYLVRVVKQ